MNWPSHNKPTDLVRRHPNQAVSSRDPGTALAQATGGWSKDGAGCVVAQNPEASVSPDSGVDPTAVTQPRPDPVDKGARLTQVLGMLPRVGTKFLGFHLIAELGKGATGKVYLAQQGDLAGRFVALKVSADLFDESQTLAQLQHTNVVPIYSIHRVSPFHAVCMPYFGSTTFADVLTELALRPAMPESGKDLVDILIDHKKAHSLPHQATWLAETQTVPCASATTIDFTKGRPEKPQTAEPPAVLRSASILAMLHKLTYVDAVVWIASRLAEGLAHAHDRGILHLDLKPANILLTDEGQPMLLDFNLAQDTKASGKERPMVGGTLSYMSPEHLRAFRREPQSLDARSDLYSLGIILYELLTGRPAFPQRHGPLHGMVAQMLQDRLQPLPGVCSENKAISPSVEAIIHHCLQPEPARRYQNAHDFIEDLQRQLHHLPLKFAPEPSLRERARKWFRRHPRVVSSSTMIIAVEALVIVALAGMTAANRQPEPFEEMNVRPGETERPPPFLQSTNPMVPTALEKGNP